LAIETALLLIQIADELQAAGRMEDAVAARAGVTAIMNQMDAGHVRLPEG
jgi:hypothetical protein